MILGPAHVLLAPTDSKDEVCARVLRQLANNMPVIDDDAIALVAGRLRITESEVRKLVKKTRIAVKQQAALEP